MAKREHSAGVVVHAGEPRAYLLLHYPSGHWDFPKGHVERGETDLQAALREVREETGIVGLEVSPGFTQSFDYYYQRGGSRIHKSVSYFVGRSPTRRVRLSHEHQGFVWLPYDRALERITYDNARRLLAHAEEFLAAGPQPPAPPRTPAAHGRPKGEAGRPRARP